MSVKGPLGLLSIASLAILAAAAPAAAKPATAEPIKIVASNGSSCSIKTSQNVDPANQKVTFGTKTTCGGSGVTMEQSFSDVQECQEPTSQITPGPGLSEVTITSEVTCKNAATGKAGVTSTSSATDPSGNVSFQGTQTAQGTGKAGETSTATSTSTFKITPTTTTTKRQPTFDMEAHNFSSFAVSNAAPVTAAQFLQVTGF